MGREDKMEIVEKTEPVKQYAYVCPDLHVTVTRIASGVKDGFKLHPQIPCPICTRRSQILPFGVTPKAQPHFEWYVPSEEDLKEMFSKANKEDVTKLKEMYDNGMLASRKL